MIGLIGIRQGRSIFYDVHPHYWGKGYCTEALGAYINALLQLNPALLVVKANVRASNLASQRVLEKCSFTRHSDHTRVTQPSDHGKHQPSLPVKKSNDAEENEPEEFQPGRQRFLPPELEAELRQSLLSLVQLGLPGTQQVTRVRRTDEWFTYKLSREVPSVDCEAARV
jgi:hypothetical protein